jgi:arylformamidase
MAGRIMYKLLSYSLAADAPTFLNNPSIIIESYTSISKGDVCNQYLIKLLNHTGSHLDAPNHFVDPGLQIVEVPLENFFYRKPCLIDLPKIEDELITAADLKPYAGQISRAELLLVRTGFGKYRRANPEKYGKSNPGFAESAAVYLLEVAPDLKAIGMDLPSACSAAHSDTGIKFHQIILGGNDRAGRDRFIMVLEDLNLAGINQLEEVWAVPLFIEGVDSAPCTVIARINP